MWEEIGKITGEYQKSYLDELPSEYRLKQEFEKQVKSTGINWEYWKKGEAAKAFTAYKKGFKKGFNSKAKKSNPSSLKVKSGEWIPCHAVRVKGGKLEIMKDALANGRKANPTPKKPIKTWNVYWAPTGQKIASNVRASTGRLAKSKAPVQYRKYKGEIYVEEV